MKEIWKDIAGYEGIYQISDMGIVKILGRIRKQPNGGVFNVGNRFLTQKTTADGYKEVSLSKDGKTTHFLVHRLEMKTFNPVANMDNLQINHINEIRNDNRLENLEWCTAVYNMNYGNRISKIKETQGCNLICLTTGEYLPSINEAAKKYKLSLCHLSRKLKLSSGIVEHGKLKDGTVLKWKKIEKEVIK